MKILLLFLLICVISISAISSEQAFATTVSVPAGTSVPGCETTNECFIPYKVSISVGEVVTWSNDDSAAHTVTSGSAADGASGVFDSSLFMAGTTFSHKFTSGGTFPYHCMVHPWMEGIVSVSGSGGETEPEDPPSPKPAPYPTPIPYGVDVVVPQGTSVPGCENSKSCYDPYTIIIEKYDTITWFNADSAAHTVTSGRGGDGPSGLFDSSLFMGGTTYSHKFENSGTFHYFCMLHPWMEGRVIVESDESEPPDVTPPKILQPKDIEVNSETHDGVTRIVFEVLVIDDTDKIIKPTCKPSSGYLFGIGETIVKCTARDSAGNFAIPVSFTVKINPPETSIPSWVKNVAEFWCEDKIDDGAFVEGIQYLIDNGIIVVSGISTSYGGTQEVPQWVKNNACWWAQGMITDEDFASGIEYLVREGIILV